MFRRAMSLVEIVAALALLSVLAVFAASTLSSLRLATDAKATTSALQAADLGAAFDRMQSEPSEVAGLGSWPPPVGNRRVTVPCRVSGHWIDLVLDVTPSVTIGGLPAVRCVLSCDDTRVWAIRYITLDTDSASGRGEAR